MWLIFILAGMAIASIVLYYVITPHWLDSMEDEPSPEDEEEKE